VFIYYVSVVVSLTNNDDITVSGLEFYQGYNYMIACSN